MKNVEVSVVIPAYNRKNTLKRAIDSVLNQTFQDLEIVIVDDCSTDGSFEYIAELYGEVEHLIYVRNDSNMGPSASRNIGASYANGKYIAFHDSDDEWMPTKLEKQMEAIRSADDDVGLVYSGFTSICEDGRELYWPPREWGNEQKEGDVFSTLLISPLVGVITLLMKKDLFLALGGFNEELKALEDYEFTLRVAYSHKFLFIDEGLAVAYESSESVGKGSDNHIITQCYIMNQYKNELEKYGLKRDKFFKVLNEAQIHNRVRSYLKNIVYNMCDEDYMQYVKTALTQLDKEEEGI